MALKKIIGILLLVLFVTACGNKQAAEFHNSQGKAFSFKDYQGRWVVINYWATWCHSCIGEIPELNKFSRIYKKQAIVIGVNYDGLSSQKLIAAIKKLHIHYPVMQEDPASYFHLQATGVVPVSYLINPKGRLVATLLGPQTIIGLVKRMHLIKRHVS
ncbi:MAG: TlpA family protein disulfide reductase [Gammaproteobacteria bacterium]|nr:TlpA family protein disulfide reductase [Gammaproteobacteria bacterium]